ncbi:MAG TPA: hypothetical protein VLM85_10320, partial [Polyangiaceae bacterium]|nr:hypothetical protein [Polyangiaceae bacterium]
MKKHLPVQSSSEQEDSNVLGRRCVLSALTAAALVGCFADTTTDPDAGDASADAGDDGEAAATCDPSLGKRVGAETTFPAGTWKLVGQLIVAQDSIGFFAF